MTTVIEVEGVSKRYRIGVRGGRTLQETLAARMRRRREGASGELWALRDVSLAVADGEAVGLVGANGAGKSTLLRILSRITLPTGGVSRTRGRVGSLLEVGTGFHPELSGRENIFLNGAVLGLKRREIRSRFDEIVAFSGVERFLDTPLKRYSSGMYLRLAFAVAAHLEPDILVVDEVLAVGDAAFREKCLGRMTQLGREGRTVLFVSHDLGAITRLCQRAVWLERGELRDDGPAHAVVDRYLASASAPVGATTFAVDESRPVQLLAAAVEAAGAAGELRRDEPFTLAVRFVVRRQSAGLSIAFILRDGRGVHVLDEDWGADTGSEVLPERLPQEYEARLTVPPVLPAGDYRLEVWIGNMYASPVREEALSFRLRPRPDDLAESLTRIRAVQAPVDWLVEPVPAPERTGTGAR
jgi:ABC-type polysaccharide/polyol phosphate transport system ATPase subunit